METKSAHNQPVTLLEPLDVKQPSAGLPITSWCLDMLAIPPKLAEQYPETIQSISELLDPNVAKFFAVPIIIGKPGGSTSDVQPTPASSPEKPSALPPLYGNPLIMRCRSGLMASMTKVTTSMLEPGLILASERVVTEETAPGLLLTWIYLNGFINDRLIDELSHGGQDWPPLARPYQCLWALEWCRYFAIDQADRLVKVIEQRLTDSLAQVLDQAYDYADQCGLDQLKPVDIMAGWSPSQRQAIADGYKRYIDRCQVDGSSALCDIARQLWAVQQPWHPNLVLPMEITLAIEYYDRHAYRLADRLYRYMKIEHVLTPIETKWFQRYLNEIIKIYCPERPGPPVPNGHTVLIAAMANYLGVPITFALPLDSKIEPRGRSQEHPSLVSNQELQLPFVHVHELVWPKEPELLDLAARYDPARVQSMARAQLLGYLAAIGDLYPHYYESADDLRNLLLTRLRINYPAWRSANGES